MRDIMLLWENTLWNNTVDAPWCLPFGIDNSLVLQSWCKSVQWAKARILEVLR